MLRLFKGHRKRFKRKVSSKSIGLFTPMRNLFGTMKSLINTKYGKTDTRSCKLF